MSLIFEFNVVAKTASLYDCFWRYHQVDRLSGTKTENLGSITRQIKPNTIKLGSYKYPV